MPLGSNERLVEEMLAADFCDEEHIQAFARALSEVEEDVPSSPVETWTPRRQPSGNSAVPRHLHHTRVRKVSAVSDFAPINTRVKRSSRRNGRKPRPYIKSESLYIIFRWPILFLLNTIIAVEFGLYVLTRQFVNAFEWLLAWRGPKRTLRSHLRNARTWEEWKRAAAVLDEFLGFNQWKREDEDPYYDYQLVRKVRRSLRTLRENNDAHGLMELLKICLRDNFAGTQSSRLYAETFYGTKDAIEALASEMESALAYVRASDVSLEEKRRFYRHANRNFGSSALCLSGGAAFGFYHFGVLKALLDANLMPRVFNGTSAGTLAAAFACTHTDDELRLLMGSRLADKITCFEEPFSTILPRLYKTGALFEAVQWARKSTWFTRGSMTFAEAYERTGKVLNISVIPADQHSPTKLLNYLTAPNCVIWSAAIASSAVPTVINPVVLMQKTRRGDIIPWNWGARFKDGSLRVDVPIQSLNLLFNVNYTIVSQLNPHIHLFWFAPRGSPGKPVAHRKGKGWRGGFLLSAAEQFLKLELTKNFKVIRDLELMPQIIGQDWSSVFLQRFDGAVTIHPRIKAKDFLRMLTDPDRPNMQRMIHASELATWPTLHMIENRFRLEREIFRGRLYVRQQTMYNSTTQDSPAPDPKFVLPAFEGDAGAPSREPSSATLRGPAMTFPSSDNELAIDERPKFGTVRSTRSIQLAIESEAEEDFESHSPSIFKRRKSLHGGGRSSRQSRRPSTSPTLPRSSVIDTMNLQQDREDEYPIASGSVRARHLSSGAAVSRSGELQRNDNGAENSSSVPATLISQLRRHSFPRFPRFGRHGQRQSTGDEHYARNDGTGWGAGTLPDGLSSDSSLGVPAFELDTSLENVIDSQSQSQDESALGSQNPLEERIDHAPQQDQ